MNEKQERFNAMLGIALREERQRKNLDQKDIAKKLGVTKMTVSYWETGGRTMNAKQLKDYCRLLGVSTDYILERT